ncbi:hypothetical protein CANINC_002375 [Pichia inconspicua]|uniref:Uncharacterized protein n=1 Tax=Pichia inconspicua TaxID=52247 RepID=A0A4T0X2L7_9ASCO|nr:hypothetical protein CANINC_002375 [[Candida] inconspicua]
MKPKDQVIKHPPLKRFSYTELDTTIYVKSSTPFMSAVKRINKMITKFEEIPNKRGNLVRRGNVSKKINYVTVKGMGKCLQKVLNIGIYFQNENFKVDTYTKTVGVIDEILNDPEDKLEADMKKRNVGAIEIRIYV